MNLTHQRLTPIPPGGLANLAAVELAAENQEFLDVRLREAVGPLAWRNRMRGEARHLLALSQIAPRMFVDYLDLRHDFKAVVILNTTVPCRPGYHGDLVIAPQAVLGINYFPEALRQPQPGFAFVQIIQPRDVWHANVGMAPPPFGQPLCLGAQLPAGVRVKELVLMAYGALTMQTVQIDHYDPAGVMNWEGASWWQLNTKRIPLSKAAFLSTDDLDGPKEQVNAW